MTDIKEIEKLHLEEGDAIVVTCDAHNTSNIEIKELAVELHSQFPTHPILLLAEGYTIQSVGRETLQAVLDHDKESC